MPLRSPELPGRCVSPGCQTVPARVGWAIETGITGPAHGTVRTFPCEARSREEDAVALDADLGIIAEGGRYCAIPAAGEAEPIGVLRRNLERRLGLHEVPSEAVCRII